MTTYERFFTNIFNNKENVVRATIGSITVEELNRIVRSEYIKKHIPNCYLIVLTEVRKRKLQTISKS
jgi:hypothetical protein